MKWISDENEPRFLAAPLTPKIFLFQEDDEEAERTKLREVSKRLYGQLQEAEKKHQEEKERLQVSLDVINDGCILETRQ